MPELRTKTLTRRFVGVERRNASDTIDEGLTAVLCKGIILSLLDIALMITAGVATFLTLAGYLMSPAHLPFKCDDNSIRRGYFPHSVTPEHLLLVTLFLPYLAIMICEAVYFLSSVQLQDRLRKYFSSTTGIFLEYLAMFAVGTIVMEAMKCFFGRLRPHFIEACKPDWSLVDCETDPTGWITNAHCTGGEIAERVARGSFPSGHSQAAAMAALFLYLYLREVGSLLIRSPTSSAALKSAFFVGSRLLQTVFLLWCCYVWMTRVTDRWHHPTDVLGGVVTGVVVVLPFFYWRTPTQAAAFRLAV